MTEAIPGNLCGLVVGFVWLQGFRVEGLGFRVATRVLGPGPFGQGFVRFHGAVFLVFFSKWLVLSGKVILLMI